MSEKSAKKIKIFIFLSFLFVVEKSLDFFLYVSLVFPAIFLKYTL